MHAVRFLIRGRVQGVFFRDSTRDQALTLGIDGWAQNLADGSVEVLACTEDSTALEQLQAWLQHGPPLARVEQVDREVVDATCEPGFRIR